jgi:hypothetical protein
MSKILLFRYILCQSVWPLTTSSKVKPSFQRYFFIDASDGFLLLFLLTYCAYFTKDHFIYARCLEKLSTNKLAIIRLNGKKCIDELDIV